jgi:hypothetical protein
VGRGFNDPVLPGTAAVDRQPCIIHIIYIS